MLFLRPLLEMWCSGAARQARDLESAMKGLYPPFSLNFKLRLYIPEIPDRTVLQTFSILEEEDLALNVACEEALRQLKVNIMGKIQLEVLEQTVLRRFQIPVSFDQPEVVYKEIVTELVMGYGHFEPLRHDASLGPGEEAFPLTAGAMWTGWKLITRIWCGLMSSKPFIREY